jgi:hypothetical protein
MRLENECGSGFDPLKMGNRHRALAFMSGMIRVLVAHLPLACLSPDRSAASDDRSRGHDAFGIARKMLFQGRLGSG